jgi:hypothetical protein
MAILTKLCREGDPAESCVAEVIGSTFPAILLGRNLFSTRCKNADSFDGRCQSDTV